MNDDFTELAVPVCGHRAVIKRFWTGGKPPEWTILALHGFTGSGADFGPLRDCLADLPVAWMCPDFMGHGSSVSPRNVDPYRLTAALALINRARHVAESPDKVLLVGYSMGGRLALHYLRWAAPLPAVLIGASPGIENAVERARRRTRDAGLMDPLSDDINAFCEAWEQQPLIEPQTRLAEPLRSDLAQRRRENFLVGLENSLAGCGAGALPSLWSVLPELPPMTCLYGEQDGKFAAIARRMQAANPLIAAQAIPEAGHAAHLENPEAVARVVKFHLGYP
jgi:2-succinyl-6-hydroxy-2,4-cyclohexadiene-1-carboxylate synthase